MQQKGVFSTLQLFTCTVLTCSLFPACCYWIIVAAYIIQWLLGVFSCSQLSHKEHTWQGRDILQRYAKLSVSLNSLWDYPSKKALKTKVHRGSRRNMHQSMQSAFRPAQPLALSKAEHPAHTCPQTYIPIVSYTDLLHLVSFWTPSADLYREIHPQTPHPSWVYLWGAGPILLLDLQNHRIIQAWITLEVSSPTSCSKQGQLWDQIMLLTACLVLKNCKDGNCTTSEQPIPILGCLHGENVFPHIFWNSLFQFPFSLVLLSCNTVKILGLSSWQTLSQNASGYRFSPSLKEDLPRPHCKQRGSYKHLSIFL